MRKDSGSAALESAIAYDTPHPYRESSDAKAGYWAKDALRKTLKTAGIPQRKFSGLPKPGGSLRTAGGHSRGARHWYNARHDSRGNHLRTPISAERRATAQPGQLRQYLWLAPLSRGRQEQIIV